MVALTKTWFRALTIKTESALVQTKRVLAQLGGKILIRLPFLGTRHKKCTAMEKTTTVSVVLFLSNDAGDGLTDNTVSGYCPSNHSSSGGEESSRGDPVVPGMDFYSSMLSVFDNLILFR